MNDNARTARRQEILALHLPADGPIWQALSLLDMVVKDQAEAVTELAERLTLVLTPLPPQPPDDPEAAPQKSPLEAMLIRFAKMFNANTKRLSDIERNLSL